MSGKRGCKNCGSTCGVDGCRVCELKLDVCHHCREKGVPA